MEENHEFLEAEEENQIEEDVKIFDSKYDNEFIGLLNEITKRLPNFNKHDNLKIKSWINILTIPCDTNETKKNRNLYGIKLINQMVNGKLEEPFIKFPNGPNDLKWLSSIDIKAELSKKFYEEIDFEKIENYGIQQQKKFLNCHPDIANKIKNKIFPNSKYNLIGYNNKTNKNKNDNNFIKNYNSKDIDDDNVNKYNESTEKNNNYPGDNNIDLDMNQMEFNKDNVNDNVYKSSEFSMTHNKKNNYNNFSDKVKLINIIRDLEQKVIEKDKIIEFQNKQIEQIIDRINLIQNMANDNANNVQ